MANGGVQYKSPFTFGEQTKPSPTSLFGNPATFTAAANTQASDYDKIMAQYANIASGNSPISVAPISAPQTSFNSGAKSPAPINVPGTTPTTQTYAQSGDVTKSLADLSDLVANGGYTDAGIADIRARDISPIRSIYANAREDAGRQKALSGGYSPNFNAVLAKMSRDEAGKIGDVTTAANAGIAQNVASNKIAAAPSYASASASANAAKTAVDQHNTDIINQINEANKTREMETAKFNTQGQTQVDQFNEQMKNIIAQANADRLARAGEFNTQAKLSADQANKGTTLDATKGMASLYGTTPALTNMFGNQVTDAAKISQGQQQINNQKLDIFGRVAAGAGR